MNEPISKTMMRISQLTEVSLNRSQAEQFVLKKAIQVNHLRHEFCKDWPPLYDSQSSGMRETPFSVVQQCILMTKWWG